MFTNIRGILNRRSDQNRSPESLLSSRSSDESSENNVDSAEGFLCPSCFIAFPTGEALQNHYEIAHSENLNGAAADARNKYVCPACKMKLGSEIELQSHFMRHHSDDKKETDGTDFQIKAWEEIKLYMENELKAKNVEVMKLKEERLGLEQMASKQTEELADLKLNLDELNSLKKRLQNALRESEEKVAKLEIDIQQRPEQDDVIELKKGITTVQEKMDELALQKEAEKDALQNEYNILQETCSNLQAEKEQLENSLKTYPKKEEIESLHQKVSEMTLAINQYKEELDKNKADKEKLQLTLQKFGNYEEIKASLAEKQSSLDELLRQSSEKDSLITKLKDELVKRKQDLEEIKVEKKRLVSEIANGKGVTEAMLQLKEENDNLRQQFMIEQTSHLKEKDECESKLSEMRSSLKKSQIELQASNEKCTELECELKQAQAALKETTTQKDTLSRELNLKITDLSETQKADKISLQSLEEEFNKLKKLYDEKSTSLENALKELKLVRTSHAEVLENLQTTKVKQDKYISDLAAQLTQVQNDYAKKEQSLNDLEKNFKELSDMLKEEKMQKSKLEAECRIFQRNSEEASERLKNLENIVAEAEAVKIDFCDKISSLNEELLKSQLEESKLNVTLENLNEVNSQVKEKCASLEDEIINLKSTVTRLQNEKNSLLNELEKVQKNIAELNELKTSQDSTIQELTDLNQKEKTHSEKVMKDFNLAKEVYLKEKQKMKEQIENLETSCAKQLSQVQETVNSLRNQLEDAEKKSEALNSSLEDTKGILRRKETEWEEMKARHAAQAGVLTENIKTLQEDLSCEQKRRENLEQELEEIRGSKLELDAKLENALEERSGLLKRCIKSEAECERLQKSVSEMRNKYEDCVAALQELGRENQTLQVENMKHVTRKWADDSEVTHCTACGKLFTVTIRKHHCRNCGNIFCNECSTKSATVASSKKPARVCDVCYAEVTK